MIEHVEVRTQAELDAALARPGVVPVCVGSGSFRVAGSSSVVAWDSSRRVAVPDRTLIQRMEALQRANEIRGRRAELKRDLKCSRRFVVDALAEPPEYAVTMKVFDLLLAAPKVGRVRAARWLRLADVSPSKTVGGLSARQRSELVGLLGGRRETDEEYDESDGHA